MLRAALFILSAIGLSLACGELRRAAASRAGDRLATAPTTTPTTPTVSTTNGFAPIAYYDEHCSRCHGQFGTGYLPDMGKRLNDDALRKVIREMADGPAAAPLDDAQLEAELAYHRSFLDGTPFIARVIASDADQAGEVTRGAALRAEVNGKSIPPSADGQTWKLPALIGASAKLIAEREGKRTTLDPGKPFSHASRAP